MDNDNKKNEKSSSDAPQNGLAQQIQKLLKQGAKIVICSAGGAAIFILAGKIVNPGCLTETIKSPASVFYGLFGGYVGYQWASGAGNFSEDISGLFEAMCNTKQPERSTPSYTPPRSITIQPRRYVPWEFYNAFRSG